MTWLAGCLTAVLTVAVGLLLMYATERHQRRIDMAWRADKQHRQWLADDPRGLYGIYPPADLDQPGGVLLSNRQWASPVSYETIRG